MNITKLTRTLDASLESADGQKRFITIIQTSDSGPEVAPTRLIVADGNLSVTTEMSGCDFERIFGRW